MSRNDYRSLKQQRRDAFDNEQSRRRTDAQNDAIVKLITKHGTSDPWSYSSLPPEGGTVILQWIPKKQWGIKIDGTVTEQPYDSGAVYKSPTSSSGL